MLIQLLVSVSLMSEPAAPAPARPSGCFAADQRRAVNTLDEDWITSLRLAVSASLQQLRRRRLSLRDVQVEQVDGAGFWIGVGACRLYVQPAEAGLVTVRPGEMIDLQGEFRFRFTGASPGQASPTPYVYAYIVRRAPSE